MSAGGASEPTLERNASPTFVGVASLKALLLSTLSQFEQWAAALEWGSFHAAHYDWWMFPISSPSSHGLKYTVHPHEVAQLQQDAVYMAAYRRGVELVLLSWGWGMALAAPIASPQPQRGQRWAAWPIRLYKMVQSLALFGLPAEHASALQLGRALLDGGAVFVYRQKDLRAPFLALPQGAALPPPPGLLFLATIAAGGGDLAFAAAAIRALAQPRSARSAPPLAYAVVAQAGRSALDVAPLLAAALESTGTAVPCLGCFARGADNAVARVREEGAAAPSPPPLPFTLRGILQGPLHLFDTPCAALAALGLPPQAPPPRLLTVREFGMARFLPPLHLQPAAGAQQVSAGLGEAEWGVWGCLPPPPPPCLPPAPSPHALGYFRTPEHGARLGALAVSALLLHPTPTPHLLRILAPRAALIHVQAGIAAHPALLRVVQLEQRESSAGSAGEEEEQTKEEEGLLFLRLEWQGPTAPLTAILSLVPLDTPSHPLPAPHFRALLSTALCAVVTGDASANEALAAGIPFLYSAEPHKAEFEAQLLACARGSAGGACGEAVAGVWDVCSTRSRTRTPRSSWAEVQERVERAGGGLKAVFQVWCAGVLERHAGLEDRLRAWAEGALAPDSPGSA